MSEINVTPFVDVMLVLLIVFMISAPLLASGVPVDLPETEAGGLTPGTVPVTVSVTNDGRIFVGDQETTIDRLVPLLAEETANDLTQRVFVRGDQASSYGAIMRVMGTINAAGYTRIGLVTVPEDGTAIPAEGVAPAP
ncbi:MAG: biopolymer transporter ExbD [Bauldia sp.]|nr:biopolymer transporter ExbD [Bauldia sp.]